MKLLFTSIFALFLTLLVVFALPVSGEEEIYNDVLRLHILADSDDTEDQQAKLLVRDAVLGAYGDLFASVESKEEAEATLRANLGRIQKTVEETLLQNGLSYQAEITLAQEWFESRSYGDVTLPAGEYTALKITLGKGEGQNFWCMLYPALCTEPAKGKVLDTAKERLNEEEYLLVTDSGYAVKFRFLEIFSSWFD